MEAVLSPFLWVLLFQTRTHWRNGQQPMLWVGALRNCASIQKQGITSWRSSIELDEIVEYVNRMWNIKKKKKKEKMHPMKVNLIGLNFLDSAEGLWDVEGSSSRAKAIWHGERSDHSDLQAQETTIAWIFQGRDRQVQCATLFFFCLKSTFFFFFSELNSQYNFRNALMGFTRKLRRERDDSAANQAISTEILPGSSRACEFYL